VFDEGERIEFNRNGIANPNETDVPRLYPTSASTGERSGATYINGSPVFENGSDRQLAILQHDTGARIEPDEILVSERLAELCIRRVPLNCGRCTNS